MSLLESIGRSKVGSDLGDFIAERRRLRMSELATEANIARSESLNELTGIQIETAENQLRMMRQEQQRLNTKEPIQAHLDRFRVEAVGKYFLDAAKRMGYVNADNTITTGNRERLEKMMNAPHHLMIINSMRLEHAEVEYQQAMRLQKDPEFRKESGFKGSDEDIANLVAQKKAQWFAATASNDNLTKMMVEKMKSMRSGHDRLTIYGPGGATQSVVVQDAASYVPPKGWSLKAPFKPTTADKYPDIHKLTKTYKMKTNTMGQIMTMTPLARKNNLVGWLKRMELEQNRKDRRYSDDHLAIGTNEIVSDLALSPMLEGAITQALDQGADYKLLKQLIEETYKDKPHLFGIPVEQEQ